MLWNHPGNDITGLIARAEKVAGTAEQVSRQWAIGQANINMMDGGHDFHLI